MRSENGDRRRTPSIVVGALLGGALLVSCGSPPSKMSGGTPMMDQTMSSPAADPASVAEQPASMPEQKIAQSDAAPQARPQLIRRAELRVIVESIPKTLKTIDTVLQKQRGDVLNASTQQPTQPNSHRTAFMTIRVPQERLDATLAELAQLGTVELQSVTAEDVSTQLVDFEARLKNLRRTEETLLKIMDRSGSVGDVLKVAQELGNVRQTIEQIDAQLTSLKNQVAFSTISLNLQEIATAGTITPRSTPLQVGETWRNSTRSLRDFSVGVLRLIIWCLVYSPYWAILVGSIWLIRRKLKATTPAEPSDPVS